VEPRSAPPERIAGEPLVLPRQRWRLVVARSADAPRLGGRELADAWEAAVEATDLPLYRPAGRARARVAFGAPLQLGIAAEHEPADLFLTERVPVWRVRDAITSRIPDGWTLVDLFDVWVGGPPLAGRVVAADYRIELLDEPDPGLVAAAARAMLEASELPRVRQRGQAAVAYDLRPLLADVTVDGTGPTAMVRIRTRIHPELGTGRPEEVVAALGDRLGRALEVRSIVREQLILADQVS